MLVTVKLYGALRRFGHSRKLDVETPREAIHACMEMIPGFRAYFMAHLEAPFRVLVDEEPQSEGDLFATFGSRKTFKIIPVVSGAHGGLGQVLLGAVMIAAGVAMWLYTPGATATTGDWLINAGLAMMLGGVVSMLAKLTASSNNSDQQTWAFGAPQLTTGQGGCVPLAYGLVAMAGTVVSSGIDGQQWQVGGFGGKAPDDNGTMGGDGVTTPWVWARNEV